MTKSKKNSGMDKSPLKHNTEAVKPSHSSDWRKEVDKIFDEERRNQEQGIFAYYKKVDEKDNNWKDDILFQVMKEGKFISTEVCVMRAIRKTEEHFNELNLLGRRDRDLHYDREMLKRTKQETAEAIFKELEKVTGDRSEHSMVIMFTRDYNKIKKKYLGDGK